MSRRCQREREWKKKEKRFHRNEIYDTITITPLTHSLSSFFLSLSRSHTNIVPLRYEAKIKSLYKVPEKFQVKEQEKTEEMLSNQMLSGIPEVNLGLE